MIDWATYFDKIYCEFFIPNKDRFERLDNELARVGIKKARVFEYSFNTPSSFDNILLKEIQKLPHLPIMKPAYVNHLLQRERIFRMALIQGYERILVLEDDIAFLRDMNQLEDILASMPQGYDAFQMDKFLLPSNRATWFKLVKENQINRHWVSQSNCRFTSAACMAYTKAGIQEMLHIIETTPGSVDQLSKSFRRKWAISIPNCAIQLVYGNATNLSYMNIERLHSVYSGIVDYRQYNCPDGYPEKKRTL